MADKTPKRIQRKRVKGWRMPEGAVYVGRPTKWGNPFLVGRGGYLAADAVRLFRKFMMHKDGGFVTRREVRRELRGKDLACWCPLGRACHADILLEIANGGTDGR